MIFVNISVMKITEERTDEPIPWFELSWQAENKAKHFSFGTPHWKAMLTDKLEEIFKTAQAFGEEITITLKQEEQK